MATICNCFFIYPFFLIESFASTAGGLPNRNAAAFSPLKKYDAHFFNYAFCITAEKEPNNPVTDMNVFDYTRRSIVHETK